jgi:hypothetical protein
LLINPVADVSEPVSPLQDTEMQIYKSSQEVRMQVYNSFSGCMNAVLSMWEWDTHSSALGLQTL